ncbi:MAG TPA: LssY C-terminal domain-containing protein [Thermoanaerobaculia bacterium]|jgi:undecaprenyl-diphosphatase|nr:LssY C-terminal domain-containing protein [Thermoanaerobaculia bacterium]
MTLHAISELLGAGALVLGIGAVFALAWLVPHRAFHHLRAPAGRVLQSPRLAGVRRRVPGLLSFVERHAHDPRPSWLRLVLGALCFAGGVLWFVHLMRGVLHDGRLVTADRCLHNVVATFDSAALVRFYSAVTTLASTAFVAPLVGVLAVVFWLAGRRRESLGLVLALGGALGLSTAFKLVIRRPRPPEAVALFRDSSFPSGHTLVAAAVYGFLAYLVLRDEPRRPWHWLLAGPLLFLVGAVPLSRIYLGMHWPYDTVGSLALAGAWLAILIALFKYPPLVARLPLAARPVRWLPWALASLAAVLACYAAWLAARNPQAKLAPPLAAVQMIPPAAALGAFPAALPKTSEDAVGGLMEPICFVFVGDTGPIIAAFARAGWQLAQPPSVRGLLRELWSVAANRADPRGPATPAFYGGQPQDLTFEKPGDPSGSIRRRHHTRLWRTGLCVAPSCTPLWVATASYDAGIKMVAEPYLLTHRIDPRVDRERDLIAGDLRRAGARVVTEIPVTAPTRGHNAGGDSFVTDGRAYVVVFGASGPGAAQGQTPNAAVSSTATPPAKVVPEPPRKVFQSKCSPRTAPLQARQPGTDAW